MTVAIIDYGSGNLRSAEKAFQRMAAETTGEAVTVTADAKAVAEADRVVLPGVGAFADCAAGLRAAPGMVEALEQRVRGDGVPFLGICVGMQLMATVGREFSDTPGLDWIAGEVVALSPDDPTLKIPHMGWNELSPTAEHPLLDGIDAGDHAYFVHSFQMKTKAPEMRVAEVDYGERVTAIVGAGNIAGTQFHPEKSQKTGLRLIANFLNWAP